MATATHTTAPVHRRTRHFGSLRLARLAVGYSIIAGTIPYLTLKFAWLTGSTVGITEPEFLKDPTLTVLNGVTAGMDLVAIVLALALTHRWGQRVPASLILVPMWVGAGFLLPIAVGVPIVAVGEAFTAAPAPSSGTGLPLEPWVQPMVYAGFAWQGVMLLTAFVLYARVRWARVFRSAATPAGRWQALPVPPYSPWPAVVPHWLWWQPPFTCSGRSAALSDFRRRRSARAASPRT